jgi:hypothetical protein
MLQQVAGLPPVDQQAALVGSELCSRLKQWRCWVSCCSTGLIKCLQTRQRVHHDQADRIRVLAESD